MAADSDKPMPATDKMNVETDKVPTLICDNLEKFTISGYSIECSYFSFWGYYAVATQCGNFKIFLSLRFYVKSILGMVEVQNLPF